MTLDPKKLMQTERLRALLVKHEGLSLKPYRCPAGKLTIGVGRNLDDVGISPKEAMILLTNDIVRVYEECRVAFPWFAELTDVRKMVIMDMTVNLGLTKLRKFTRMLSAMGFGRYEMAAVHMLDSTWAQQVGERARRLAMMMKTGEFPEL